MPAGQMSGALLPSEQKKPGGHGCDVLVVGDVALQVRPAGHAPVQLLVVALGRSPTRPAGQGTHDPVEVVCFTLLYLPAGHAAAVPSAHVKPSSHMMHSKSGVDAFCW